MNDSKNSRWFVLLRKEEEEEVKEEKRTLARTVVKAWNSSFCALMLLLLLFPLFSLNSLLFVFFSSRECEKEWGARWEKTQKFRKNTKERKLLSFVCVKTREPKRKKERKKEKESANATTRIILLSIAQYRNHLLCASVIFHYSN